MFISFALLYIFVSDIGRTALLFSSGSKGHMFHLVSPGAKSPEKNVQKAAPLFSKTFTKQTVQLTSFIFSSFYISTSVIFYAHIVSFLTSADPFIFVFSFAEFFFFHLLVPLLALEPTTPSTKTWHWHRHSQARGYFILYEVVSPNLWANKRLGHPNRPRRSFSLPHYFSRHPAASKSSRCLTLRSLRSTWSNASNRNSSFSRDL